MEPLSVILIFDVGKTNKKILLFDEKYNIVLDESIRLEEISDEDGFPCENLAALTDWVKTSLERLLKNPAFTIKAVNFSAYGASFVYVDETGKPLLPLYNYLKPYPEKLLEKFYTRYGGKEEFTKQAASPVLGSLNSGLQLYRIKHEKPEVFKKIKFALHLPQYLSYLISGSACSEITSIGCHTNLWNFSRNDYQEWVTKEDIITRLPPLCKSDQGTFVKFGHNSILIGAGLHDSSAALIPYLSGFHEPFILLSTGTWCISLNPFNYSSLTKEELEKDCLCYLTYQGKPVKASRLFAGYEHEKETKRLAEHYGLSRDFFNTLDYNHKNLKTFAGVKTHHIQLDESVPFSERDLSEFGDVEEAYHELIKDIVARQLTSTKLILQGTRAKRIFVDGGFSQNSIYMHLMAMVFPELEVYAASVAQASALGAALAVHHHWNNKPLPTDIIALKYYYDTPS